MVNSKKNCWLPLSPQDVPKHPVHIIVFGMVTSDGNIMLPLILTHRGLWERPGVGDAGLNWDSWLLEYPTSTKRTLHHAIQVGEPSLFNEKISTTISPLTSGCLTPQTVTSLIIMCGTYLNEKPPKLSSIPKMNQHK